MSIQCISASALLQASWWYLVPADAVELVRVSSLKTVKALQTVARFFTQVCTDIARHRSGPSQLRPSCPHPCKGHSLRPCCPAHAAGERHWMTLRRSLCLPVTFVNRKLPEMPFPILEP